MQRVLCENACIFAIDPDVVMKMIDEAHFHLTGPLLGETLTILDIVGFCYFEEEEGSITVASALYVYIFQNFLLPKLHQRQVNIGELTTTTRR